MWTYTQIHDQQMNNLIRIWIIILHIRQSLRKSSHCFSCDWQASKTAVQCRIHWNECTAAHQWPLRAYYVVWVIKRTVFIHQRVSLFNQFLQCTQTPTWLSCQWKTGLDLDRTGSLHLRTLVPIATAREAAHHCRSACTRVWTWMCVSPLMFTAGVS